MPFQERAQDQPREERAQQPSLLEAGVRKHIYICIYIIYIYIWLALLAGVVFSNLVHLLPEFAGSKRLRHSNKFGVSAKSTLSVELCS